VSHLAISTLVEFQQHTKVLEFQNALFSAHNTVYDVQQILVGAFQFTGAAHGFMINQYWWLRKVLLTLHTEGCLSD